MIFSLGHSTLSEREFVQAARGIDCIVDVRSHPGSRHSPQFNRENMERWLPAYGIRYEWWPGLGGWTYRHLAEWEEEMAQRGVDVRAYAGAFPKQRINLKLEPTREGPEWFNAGFRDFSYYMMTGEFLNSAALLLGRYAGNGQDRVAMVCSESTWWRCHRGMVADFLTWRGVPCYHLPIKPPKRETTPRFKLHAEAIGDRLQRYDNPIIERWTEWACQEKALEFT